MNGELMETTTGRTLLAEVVPPEIPFPFINQVMDKKALGELIDQAYRRLGNKATVLLADRLRTLGYVHATKAGVSICLDDMMVPPDKERFISEAQGQVGEVENQYLDGLISDGERYNKVIDIWANATEKIAAQLLENLGVSKDKGAKDQKIPSFNSIYMMADSGARGSAQQIRQLAGMRGLMAKPSGEIIETPITSNFREGLSAQQYFISTHGARKGLADTALKTANSGYLTRRLVDVAQDVIIRDTDCLADVRQSAREKDPTRFGIRMTSLVEGGDIIEGIGERILGRTSLIDVLDPVTRKVLVKHGDEINEDRVKIIEEAGVDEVWIRSVLTCSVPRGVCVKCYGRDLARGTMVNMGEAVGVIAAQSIGEPGTQLTMRTFHIGGAATRRVEASHHETTSDGTIRYSNLRTVKDRDGRPIAMNRNGEIGIFDPSGRERERYPVTYGAHIKVEDGQFVKAGAVLCEWDPFANPILTEQTGTIKLEDIVEGATMQEQVDEFTGLSSRVIVESKDPDMRPRVSVLSDAGDVVYQALLPVGAYLSVSEGHSAAAADAVAKIPRQMTKTKDITGGLPRVAELFEARKPKETAIVTEVDGTVGFGPDSRGKRRVIVTTEDGEPREYLIPKGKHVSVHEGDRVRKGEPLMDGSANPHDILRIEGEQELAKWMVDEVQEVYRLQGVKINDKHIEIIIRQMLRKLRVKEAGDTDLLVGEQVDKVEFDETNRRMKEEGKKQAIGEPILLGITKASLSTESWISAASFQETTKVLTEGSIWGKTDLLHGLKENVIMGRLIPAGTGLARYTNIGIQIDAPAGGFALEEASSSSLPELPPLELPRPAEEDAEDASDELPA
jgi:DNA-directed RNA polymerase subunit beta'